MTTLIFQPSQIPIARGQPSPRIVLGEESVLSPKTFVELALGDDYLAEARLDHLRHVQAHQDAEHLMSGSAAEALRRAERYPRSSVAWTQAGFAQLAAADPIAALASFDQALERDPHSRSARLGAARALFEGGRAEQAIKELRSLLSENRDDGEVATSLAVVLTDSGRTKEALGLLESISENATRGPSVRAIRGSLRLALGKGKEAVADLRAAARAKPDWVHARNALGLAHLSQGNTQSAEREFREAIRVAPNYEPAFVNLLRVMGMAGRFDELLDTCGYRFSPANAPGSVARIAGIAALEVGRWQTAITWLGSALEKTDEALAAAIILNQVGCAYSRLGNQKEAGKKFELSVQKRPNEVAIVNRAKAFLLDFEPRLALDWLQSTIELLSPPSFERRKTLANALRAGGMPREAVEVELQLIASGEADADVYLMLTSALVDELGEPERAIDYSRAGLKNFPDHAALINNLAYALIMSGHGVDEASQLLARELSSQGVPDTILTATRGLLALRQGDLVQGRRLYEQALGLASTEALRERVRAKRDLEVARALLREGGREKEARELLERARKASDAARPYQLHADAELRRLR